MSKAKEIDELDAPTVAVRLAPSKEVHKRIKRAAHIRSANGVDRGILQTYMDAIMKGLPLIEKELQIN